MHVKQVILTFLALPTTPLLRPIYNRYFCHITIEKWSQIFTGTIRNGFLKDILFLGFFPIVIPIVNLIANLDSEGDELSL